MVGIRNVHLGWLSFVSGFGYSLVTCFNVRFDGSKFIASQSFSPSHLGPMFDVFSKKGKLDCVVTCLKDSIPWVWPPPRMPVSQDDITFPVGDSNLNLHLPRLHPGRGPHPKYTMLSQNGMAGVRMSQAEGLFFSSNYQVNYQVVKKLRR